MAGETPPRGEPTQFEFLHSPGDDGWVYSDWRLTASVRDKMTAHWPELDLPWVDLAAREFEAAWLSKGSNRERFVGWREDIESLSVASHKLLKVLEDCALPARHFLGTRGDGPEQTSLYAESVELVRALVALTDRARSRADNVDARRLTHPMPDLIIKLAKQLRYAGVPWGKAFKPQLTRLTTLALDGLELRHAIDIRSSVKDALQSGDQRLENLR